MDILTYVISGALLHEDSISNGSIIKPGEVQLMSAGTSVTHSEMNASADEPVHFLQIRIVPDQQGLMPSYEQKQITSSTTLNQWQLIAGPIGSDALTTLNSDTSISIAQLEDGQAIDKSFAPNRKGFLQQIDGMVDIDEERLVAGDGLQFDNVSLRAIKAKSDAEVMLLDLP